MWEPSFVTLAAVLQWGMSLPRDGTTLFREQDQPLDVWDQREMKTGSPASERGNGTTAVMSVGPREKASLSPDPV